MYKLISFSSSDLENERPASGAEWLEQSQIQGYFTSVFSQIFQETPTERKMLKYFGVFVEAAMSTLAYGTFNQDTIALKLIMIQTDTDQDTYDMVLDATLIDNFVKKAHLLGPATKLALQGQLLPLVSACFEHSGPYVATSFSKWISKLDLLPASSLLRGLLGKWVKNTVSPLRLKLYQTESGLRVKTCVGPIHYPLDAPPRESLAASINQHTLGSAAQDTSLGELCFRYIVNAISFVAFSTILLRMMYELFYSIGIKERPNSRRDKDRDHKKKEL